MTEKEGLKVISERDTAEECVSQLYYIVTGRSPQWSNLFGFKECEEEIADAITLLKETIKLERKKNRKNRKRARKP